MFSSTLALLWYCLSYAKKLSFKSLGEALNERENYWVVRFICYCLLCYTRSFNCQVSRWNPSMWSFKWELLKSSFMWHWLIYNTVQSGSNFFAFRWNLSVRPFKWKLSNFMWYCFLCCTTDRVLNFKCMDETIVW